MAYKNKLKGLITSKGFSLTDVCNEFNKRVGKDTTIQNFSKRLNSENLKYPEVEIILDIIGYKITWQEKS